jgi:DNA-binding CsgD family transcriptional regulator
MQGKHFDEATARLANAIQHSDGQNLEEILESIAASMDLKHIAYLRFLSYYDTRVLNTVVTYSMAWQVRYFEKNYALIDPVINRGAGAVLPFDWEALKCDDPLVQEFFADAKTYGVGINGISVPVRSRTGRVCLVSLTSDHSREDWIDYKKRNMATIQRLSVLIDSAASITRQSTTSPPALSKHEESCLELVRRGYGIRDIAEVSNLSASDVLRYLDTARHKLLCISVKQAIGRHTK